MLALRTPLAELRSVQSVNLFGSHASANRRAPESPRFEWIDQAQEAYRLALAAQLSAEEEDEQKTIEAESSSM